MKTNIITIETKLSPEQLIDRLHNITITDLSQIYQSPGASYYGQVSSYTFDLMNVNYGPMSSIPPIQGEIKGISPDNHQTIVKVKMDIQSHYKLSRRMYFSTLLPIGVVVMLLSFLVLGGTQYQVHGFIFSVSFIACAILAALLTKSSLINTRHREVKNFAHQIEGKIIPSSVSDQANAHKSIVPLSASA